MKTLQDGLPNTKSPTPVHPGANAQSQALGPTQTPLALQEGSLGTAGQSGRLIPTVGTEWLL